MPVTAVQEEKREGKRVKALGRILEDDLGGVVMGLEAFVVV